MKDRNGYIPSLISKEELCYFCKIAPVVRHEVFHGAYRTKSKALGLWMNLCPDCHSLVHNDAELQRSTKKQAQVIAMEYYGWSVEDFRKEFGKSYIE